LGGTKLAVALISSRGDIWELVDVGWRTGLGTDLGESEDCAPALIDALAQQVIKAIDSLDVRRALGGHRDVQESIASLKPGGLATFKPVDLVRKVGISCKGPIALDGTGTAVLGPGKKLTTLPFRDIVLASFLVAKLREHFGVHIPVEMRHDGVCSVIGESRAGALRDGKDGCAVIIGTGFGVGILRNGVIAFEEYGSLGRFLVYVPIRRNAYRYEFIEKTAGEPYRDVEELRLEKPNAVHCSERLAGPWLARRIADRFFSRGKVNKKFADELKSVSDSAISLGDEVLTAYLEGSAQTQAEKMQVERNLLITLTEAARSGVREARSFLAAVAEELGRALAPFIYRFSDEAFAERIVLVSSVAENIGKGVKRLGGRDGDGDDPFMALVQEAAKKSLMKQGMAESTASTLASGIVRSEMSHEREYLAFAD